jgi:hypothetical protein
MIKEDITLKVSDTIEWLEEMGATVNVTTWDNDDDCMIDQHVVEQFTELNSLGLSEEAEGDMYCYDENVTVEIMIANLKSLGFNVERFDGTSF